MNDETPINAAEIDEVSAPEPETDAPPADESSEPEPPADESSEPEPPAVEAESDGKENVPENVNVEVEDENYPPLGAAPSEQLACAAYRLFRQTDEAGNYPPWKQLNDSEKGLLVKKATAVFSGITPSSEYENCVAQTLGLPIQ